MGLDTIDNTQTTKILEANVSEQEYHVLMFCMTTIVDMLRPYGMDSKHILCWCEAHANKLHAKMTLLDVALGDTLPTIRWVDEFGNNNPV